MVRRTVFFFVMSPHKKLGNLVNLTISGKHGKFCELSFISMELPKCLPFQRHIIHYNRLLLIWHGEWVGHCAKMIFFLISKLKIPLL